MQPPPSGGYIHTCASVIAVWLTLHKLHKTFTLEWSQKRAGYHLLYLAVLTSSSAIIMGSA